VAVFALRKLRCRAQRQATELSLWRKTGHAQRACCAGRDYSGFGCRVLEDEFQDFGPLASIARAMREVREPLLLVLAVDMPSMRGDFLKKISANCSEVLGAVPRVNGIIEPLAAFYPKSANGLIQKMLAGIKLPHSSGAKHIAEQCVQQGLVRFITVPPGEAELFKSWNSSADLPPDV